jgi:hypothetical protein
MCSYASRKDSVLKERWNISERYLLNRPSNDQSVKKQIQSTALQEGKRMLFSMIRGRRRRQEWV